MNKRKKLIVLLMIIILQLGGILTEDNYNKLTKEEKRVIVDKGTEMPFSGKYDNFYEIGTYVCKRCEAPLFNSTAKFNSSCGWPSFDDEIEGAVKKQIDFDGLRTEILCSNCGAHLGHLFLKEGFTDKNKRYCVNSISLTFIPKRYKKAYFAGGCFWGVEYFLEKQGGVINVVSGYMGGKKANPTYEQVITGKTGHLEAVEVFYDSKKTNYEILTKYFFEIHDPTQTDGQGPDIGSQYLSVVFYSNKKEKEIAENLVKILETKGYKITTKIFPASTFWQAEPYHQNYYKKTKKLPYCHSWTKRF